MKHLSLYLVLMLAAFELKAQDTPALDYFNKASREFVRTDKITALRTLDAGLRNYPGDPRMLELARELLKEDEKKQQQQQQKDKQDQQEKKNDQQKDQQQDGQKEQGEKNGTGQPEGEPNRPGEQPKNADQQRRPGSIAPQDARRMLDALDRKEKEVQDKVRVRQRPASRIPIEKDW